MASSVIQKVGGKVMECSINLGDFVMKANLFIMIFGSDDIVIGMDWLELHDAILNCKMKQLNLTNDLAHSTIIVGKNQGMSLRFISSLQLKKSMCKGCKIYTILTLNKKGEVEGLENLLVVQEFAYIFPEELRGLPLERELEFTIDMESGTEPITICNILDHQ
jgi:hypothetical protein